MFTTQDVLDELPTNKKLWEEWGEEVMNYPRMSYAPYKKFFVDSSAREGDPKPVMNEVVLIRIRKLVLLF